jgi:hypothetical protein
MSEHNSLGRPPSRWLTCDGETHHLNQWAALTGMAPATITGRLQRGWTEQEALSTPPNRLFANGNTKW